MKITIVGAGAIGLLFAAKLAPCCESLELVTHTEAQAALLRDEWIELDGRIDVPDAPLTIHAYELAGVQSKKRDPEADYILLTIKQAALSDEFIRYVAGRLGKHGKLVCFQNGLGHAEKLQAYVPIGRLFMAVTTEGAKKIGDGSVVHTGRGTTYIGSANEEIADSGIFDPEDFCELLNKAGFHAETSNRIISKVWNKLVINAAINPVTAILRVTNGELLHDAAAMKLMRDLYEEALTVAGRIGIELSSDLWEQIIDVCRLTSSNLSSMLQDVLAGRVTEIDWITGALLAIGESEGLKLPVNSRVYRLVKALESE